MDELTQGPLYKVREASALEITEQKSLDFAKWLSCLARPEDGPAHESYVRRFPKSLGVKAIELDLQTKAAVLPGTTTNAVWAQPLVGVPSLAAEFVKIARSASLLGRIPGLRDIPFNAKLPIETQGASYQWVSETAPTPVSKLTFDAGILLAPLKAVAIIVLSRELVRLSVVGSERALRDTLVAGLVAFTDLSFLDPTSTAIAGTRPASVTAGTTPVASTGNLTVDVQSLIDAFYAGNPGAQNPVLIAGGMKAAQLRGLNPGFGYPILSSEAAGGTVVMLDPSKVFVADGNIEVATSGQAAVQMSDSPDNPPTSATTLISMFQTNSVAFRVNRFLNFQALPNAVRYLAAS